MCLRARYDVLDVNKQYMYFKLYYRHSGMNTIKVKYVWNVNIVHPRAAVEVLKLLIVFSLVLIFESMKWWY